MGNNYKYENFKKESYELQANKYESLDEKYKFLEKYKLKVGIGRNG